MMKIKKKAVYFLIIVLFFIIVFIYNQNNKKEDVDLDVLFIKTAIVENGEALNTIKVKNSGLDIKEFSLSTSEGITDLLSIEESNFELAPNEEKSLKIFFKSKNRKPGIYIGNLKISFNKELQKIPIILEVQSKEVLFDSNVNLFLKDGKIIPGEKLVSEIKIFDLANIGRRNVELIYFVKDFDERTIISESENVIVDGKLDYSKSIILPEKIRVGDYVLGVAIKYKESISTSSVYFSIVREKSDFILQGWVSFFAILFAILFIALIILLIYSFFSKDKLMKELKGQYKKEVEREKQLIRLREKKDYKKFHNDNERNVYKKELDKIKLERIKLIKEIYKKRVRKFKEIKKRGNSKQLINQMKKWKNQGYDTSILENKYKLPNVSNIKKKIKEWDDKGYDTSVLERKSKF